MRVINPVSYTHLDVYKRQALSFSSLTTEAGWKENGLQSCRKPWRTGSSWSRKDVQENGSALSTYRAA